MPQDETDELKAAQLPSDTQTDIAVALRALDFSGMSSEWERRHQLLETDAGDAFLARNAGLLAEIVAAAEPRQRRFLALLCAARDVERYAGPLAALAVDADGGVRSEALAGLSWLDAPRQVEVLRPHLRTAPSDRLAGVVRRLADIGGGIAAIEDALTAPDGQPRDPDRAKLLRSTLDRASRTGGPDAVVSVPPMTTPDDAEVLAESDTLAVTARLLGEHFWPDARRWLLRIPDVRLVRDVLREAGMIDADRRVAALLTTADRYGSKIGSVLTREDAERWWPLFAERPDLVDEHLDGIDSQSDDYDDVVDTTDMMLKILEGFPAVPKTLLPRLTSIALGASRHRRAARRVLGDDPRVRAAARAMLDGGRAEARASAAEWLADLGEAGIVPPEPGWEFGDGVLPRAVRTLPAAALWWLDRFKEQALEAAVPAAEVDRWLGLARPVLRTARSRTAGSRAARSGDGPVMGRLGGPLMLPPDFPTPADRDGSPGEEAYWEMQHQLIATLDLAAVPREATDLRFPPDGTLLLFANPDWEPVLMGGAVYIPAGVTVEERKSSFTHEIPGYGAAERLDEELRRIGDLRLVCGVSLPATPPDDEMLADHPHASTLAGLWHALTSDDGYGEDEWQVGGHPADFDGYGDPVAGSAEYAQRPSHPDDWVLLAQWKGMSDGNICWTITRQDLAAPRFDRVLVLMQANP